MDDKLSISSIVVIISMLGISACGEISKREGFKPIPVQVGQNQVAQVVWCKNLLNKFASSSPNLQISHSHNVIAVSKGQDLTLVEDLKWIDKQKLPFKVAVGPTLTENGVLLISENNQLILWDTQHQKIKWQVPLVGEFFASPTVYEGTVVINSSDGGVTAYNLHSGKLKWNMRIQIPNLVLDDTSAPAHYFEHVVVGLGDGNLVSLNTDSGQIAWSVPFGSPSKIKDLDNIISINNLSLYDDKVIASAHNGRVGVLSKYTGNTFWLKQIDGISKITISEDMVYVIDHNSKIYAWLQKDGELSWENTELQGHMINYIAAAGDYVVAIDAKRNLYWLSQGVVVAKNLLSSHPAALEVTEDGLMLLLTNGDLVIYGINA